MLHHAPLLSTIAVGLVAAFILGFAASKIKLSPIVGYLAAGMAIGPFTPGFVGDVELGRELSEIGVVLLMFGVGLHFSFGELVAVRRVALPGAVGQMAVAAAAGTGLGLWLGWGLGASMLFGLALSVASTVVMLRSLEDRGLVDTRAGHIAIGWLIVEDLAMVVALVVVPVAAVGDLSPATLSAELGLTALNVTLFVAIMMVVGRRVVPWLLARVADTGSRELFTLGVLALGLGVAVGAAWLFEVSFALGAFFAGMILKESPLARRAADDSLPLRDAFAVLFFVSVGMLVNPAVFVEHPVAVLGTTLVIVAGKGLVAFGIVRALKYSRSMALVVAAALAQIGEFSFILVTLGRDLDLLSAEASDLVLAGAITSIVINPFLFAWAARAYRAAGEERHHEPALAAASAPGHVVVVGTGRVGSRTAEHLRDAGVDVVIVDDNEERLAGARDRGFDGVLGNAARGSVLREAGIDNASHLLITIPDPLTSGAVIDRARALAPDVIITARGHGESDVEYLTGRGADAVAVGVHEVARILAERAGADT